MAKNKIYILIFLVVLITGFTFSATSAKTRKTISEEERSLAMLEVQNVMGRYALYYPAHMNEEIIELWAQHTPDTRLEMVWGVYDGIEGVKRCYYEDHKNPGAGHMIIHTMTSPVIEIAGDGKTAKAAWISPGLQSNATKDGGGSSGWSWCKYGCDFIKEDGKWKFWHFHVYGIFMTDYDTPWTETASENQSDGDKPAGEDAGAGMMMMSPDRPVTVEPWDYCTTCEYPEDQPRVPEPYYTFSETFSY